MNTTTHRTRTLLATAAAGALILGSASASMASPRIGGAPESRPASHVTHGRSHDAAARTNLIQLRSVDVHRHSPVNVFATAPTRIIKVRATARDTAAAAKVVGGTVVLAQYSKKHGALVTTGAVVAPQTVALTVQREKRKSTTLTGTLTLDKSAIAAVLPVGATAYLCLDTASLTTDPADFAQAPVSKKVGGGDCVKIVNVDPTTLRTNHRNTR